MTLPTNGPDGSLITYAQNREDFYLYGMIGHRTPGVYVDVGCNDELHQSVTRLFYELGWRGLNIDPNPLFAHGYQSARPDDQFINVGVGERSGTLRFRTYPRHPGLSTFDETVMADHANSDIEMPYVDRTIPVRTLTELLDKFGIGRIDFLKIDVEGMEGSVLRGLDFGRFRPAVIIVEGSRRDDCDAVLLSAEYRCDFFDGLNLYYISEAAIDVSIQNFASRVLGRPTYTSLEARLLGTGLGIRHHLRRAAVQVYRRGERLARRLRLSGPERKSLGGSSG